MYFHSSKKYHYKTLPSDPITNILRTSLMAQFGGLYE
jgi:hypothetical protein